MRVGFSEDPRDFARRDWSHLVAADPTATIFHTPRYLKLYWEEFGHEAELLLAFVVQDGDVAGAAAFELRDGLLRFLGGTEVTDYMGPVALPGVEEQVAKELMEALAGRDGWDRADLQGLPDDGPWLGRLQDAAASLRLGVEVGEDSVAPCIELPGTYEEYLANLPGKLRHEIRRKARRLEQQAGPRRIVHATPETLGRDLGVFVAMHQSSEGPKGKFMNPQMEIFFRRLGEAFMAEGIFHLVFLEAENERMAGLIGFQFQGTNYLYNSAYNHAFAELAPGMVLVADLIEDAIRHGCRRFDMLKGDLVYKYRFGARPRPIKRLVLSR